MPPDMVKGMQAVLVVLVEVVLQADVQGVILVVTVAVALDLKEITKVIIVKA